MLRYDKEGFSIWRVDFKYNEELTQTFMSNNQIGGFFNRLEASRKYLFGSVGVLGKSNDSIITGVLILRGQDYVPVVDVAPDWESYTYKAVSLDNADDKAFFEAALAWDLVVDGKEWADGKTSSRERLVVARVLDVLCYYDDNLDKIREREDTDDMLMQSQFIKVRFWGVVRQWKQITEVSYI